MSHKSKSVYDDFVHNVVNMVSPVGVRRIPGLAIVWSVWIAIIYSERLVYDRMIWRTDGDFLTAVLGADVIAAALFTFALHLIALVIQREQSLRWAKWARRQVKGIRLGHVVIFVAALFIIALAQGVFRGLLIIEVIRDLSAEVAKLVVHLSMELAIAAAFAVIALLLWIIHELVGRRPSLARAVQESIIGSFFVFVSYACFLLIWQLAVWHHLPAEARTPYMWAAQFKDTCVLVVVFVLYVGPLHRFGLTCERLSRKTCWQVAARYAYIAIPVAALLLLLDVQFAESLRSPSSVIDLAPWQRDVIIYHIYIRDFGLLVPFVVAVYSWTIWKIETKRVRHPTTNSGQHH